MLLIRIKSHGTWQNGTHYACISIRAQNVKNDVAQNACKKSARRQTIPAEVDVFWVVKSCVRVASQVPCFCRDIIFIDLHRDITTTNVNNALNR